MTANDSEGFVAAQKAVPLGRYRHYKSPTYVVIGYIWMAETEEWGVLYLPEDERAKLVAQSVRRFTEIIPGPTPNDESSPRFYRIG